MENGATRFCQYCGAKISEEAVVCTACGRQVKELKHESYAQPSIVINNANSNANTNTNVNNAGGRYGRPKNKWAAFFLCLFFGYLGAHKFYEERAGRGVLYLFTGGLFGIGWLVDTIILLFKPNPYYV